MIRSRPVLDILYARVIPGLIYQAGQRTGKIKWENLYSVSSRQFMTTGQPGWMIQSEPRYSGTRLDDSQRPDTVELL